MESSASKFAVSSWEEDLNDINEEENPHESPEKEILWSAEHGDLEKIKSILSEFPNTLNTRDQDGYTPLHRACYNDNIAIVDYLIEKGADVSASTEMGWQPLHCCSQWNRKEIALRLIQAGADVNALSDSKQTPLHIAASCGASYDFWQLLLITPGIKPHLTNTTNDTAYDIAKRSSKFYNIFEMADPNLEI